MIGFCWGVCGWLLWLLFVKFCYELCWWFCWCFFRGMCVCWGQGFRVGRWARPILTIYHIYILYYIIYIYYIIYYRYIIYIYIYYIYIYYIYIKTYEKKYTIQIPSISLPVLPRLLSFAFLGVFGGFQAAQGLQSSLNAELGELNLACLRLGCGGWWGRGCLGSQIAGSMESMGLSTLRYHRTSCCGSFKDRKP
jgi:hypothetical protein